jgi:enamine deaminase RidA (YjgF/YER057c/UK114 family)
MILRLAEEERLSGVVVHGNLVYLAGQVADDTSLDTEGQTLTCCGRSTGCWPFPAPARSIC